MPSVATDFDFSAIRCVAFDAVGTLIEATPSVAAVYAVAARRFGSTLTEEVVRPRLRAAFRRPRAANGDPHVTSEPLERAFWRDVVNEVLDDVSHAAPCFEELFDWFGHSHAWRCFPEVRETVSALRRAGMRLAVASNFDDRLNRVLDGLPEVSSIEVRAISSLIGFRKPSPRFYTALSEMVGHLPHEILMVGDDWDADIVGAREAGLPAVYLARDDSRVTTESRGSTVPRIHHLAELIPLLAATAAQ
jgi:putative hydrolase of the HAD superfamily